MARPKLEDQEIDLNTIDQLNKSIDLGMKHNYRFQNGEPIQLTSELASFVKRKLMEHKPAKRIEYINRMMHSATAFHSALTELF